MKIEQSQLALSCNHQAERQSTSFSAVCPAGSETLFGDFFRQYLAAPASPADAPKEGVFALGAETAPRIRHLFEELLAALREILLKAGEGQSTDCCKASDLAGAMGDAVRAGPSASQSRWTRLDFQRLSEKELTQVSAQGCVTTADGREIAFKLDLGMSREAELTRLGLKSGSLGRLVDPLVINFDGTAAELVGQTFRFDLNGDGQQEDIPLLAGGRGFLAFDRNSDGRIENGSELFGALSGQGFEELARLDQDKNGWLDEADPDFERLSVWKPAAEGEGLRETLAQAGVGAIGLSSVSSPFQIKGDGLVSRGLIRETGVWLAEDGRVGSVQQVDLAV